MHFIFQFNRAYRLEKITSLEHRDVGSDQVERWSHRGGVTPRDSRGVQVEPPSEVTEANRGGATWLSDS